MIKKYSTMFITKNLLSLVLLCSLVVSSVQAQTPANAQTPVFNGTVEEQFDVLLKNSFPYDNFKLVREQLPRFKKNTLDSLQSLRQQIGEQNSLIAQQKSSIDSLNNHLQATEKLVKEEASISFIGIPLNKGTYHFIVWGIILVLVIALLATLQRFKSNSRAAKESREAEEAIRQEYEQHRKKAMEREQKLKRDLQDELNKSSR